jgi:hypothetical protein
MYTQPRSSRQETHKFLQNSRQGRDNTMTTIPSTWKRRDEELIGKRPARGDLGRGRRFPRPSFTSDHHPLRPPAWSRVGGRLMAGDGLVLDHMGSEEDEKMKDMARNGGRERGHVGAGLCRCRRCSMSRRALCRSCKNKSEWAFFYAKGYVGFSFHQIARGEQGIIGRLVPTRKRSTRNFASFPGHNSERIQTAEFEPQIPDSVIPSLNSYIQTHPKWFSACPSWRAKHKYIGHLQV